MPIVEISNGELVDKWTILQIKLDKLQDSKQVENVSKELSLLHKSIIELEQSSETRSKILELRVVNEQIWQLMESLYEIEDFRSPRYLELTIDITRWNQQRAFIKKSIDTLSNSSLTEAKSFFEKQEYILGESKNKDA